MGRQAQQERVEAIYQSVEQNPGERAADVARRLGLDRSEVTRYLPVLEDKGLLVAEDDKGRLWPFGVSRKS
jgi:Mn-dependent DtxR family transcriptional regulator